MNEHKKQKILIVEDMMLNRIILSKIFENIYEIEEAENGMEAIKILKHHGNSFAIILLDLIMPVLDGFAVLDYMKKTDLMSRVPIVVITADNHSDSIKRSYEYGVSDIVYKPFDKDIIIRRVQNVVALYNSKRTMEQKLREQENELIEKSRELKENNEFLVDALSSVVEFRSIESGTHIRRIKDYTRLLIENISNYFPEYSIPERNRERIIMASALHDIGKVGIKDEILLKPGRFTEDEFEIMKKHTTIGGEIINKFRKNNDSGFYRDCFDICMYHHERWDGGGYPMGLKKDEIPISAQIVSVSDVFDALVSKRVYKSEYTPEKALAMIYSGECGVFSPILMECLDYVKDDFALMASNLDYSV